MKKTYNIVEKTWNKKKTAVIVTYGSFTILCFLNDKYKFLPEMNSGIFLLFCTPFVILPLFYILIAVKNYKIIGKLTLSLNEIIIETKEELILPLSKVDSIILNYVGKYGDSSSVGGLGAAYSSDGSGNIFEIFSNSVKYEYNIALNNENDLKAFHILAKEIEKSYSITIKQKTGANML